MCLHRSCNASAQPSINTHIKNDTVVQKHTQTHTFQCVECQLVGLSLRYHFIGCLRKGRILLLPIAYQLLCDWLVHTQVLKNGCCELVNMVWWAKRQREGWHWKGIKGYTCHLQNNQQAQTFGQTLSQQLSVLVAYSQDTTVLSFNAPAVMQTPKIYIFTLKYVCGCVCLLHHCIVSWHLYLWNVKGCADALNK